MTLRGLVIIVSILFSPFVALPQKENLMDRLIEELLPKNEDGQGLEEIIEELEHYRNSPYDINDTVLLKNHLPIFISAFQAYTIINYVRNYGELVSVYELPFITGFTTAYGKLIEPFVHFRKGSIKNYSIKKKMNHELSIKFEIPLQRQAIYKKSKKNRKSLGGKYKNLIKYKFDDNSHIGFSLVAEKDVGEKNQYRLGTIYDFISMGLEIRDKGRLECLILGDYHFNIGQGLLCHTSYGAGKTLHMGQMMRSGKVLRRYSSSDENRFFRGVASTIAMSEKFKVTILGSNKRLDASLASTNQGISFRSIDWSGLHDTESKLARRKNLKESVLGMRMERSGNTSKVGVSLLRQKFNYIYNPSSIHRTNYPIAKEYIYKGVDIRKRINNFVFFSEGVLLGKQGKAYQLGGILPLHNRLTLLMMYRAYDSGYFSFYANGLGENATLGNEKGVLYGIDFDIMKFLKLRFYADFYDFPWLKYQVPLPSSKGEEYKLGASYIPLGNYSVNLLLKREIKDKEVRAKSYYKFKKVEKYSSIQLDFEIWPNENIKLKSRVHYVHVKSEDMEEGGLFYQDIIYTWPNFPMKMGIRACVFDTKSYTSRIYAYENDVLHSFSVPAFFGKGARYYINIHYKWKKLSCYLKYGLTTTPYKAVLGVDNEQIEGNNKSEIKILLRLKL